MGSGHGNLWIGIGLVGQLLFGARFAVQWLYSEIKGKSRVPDAFWYLSVVAGTLLLAYAVHRSELPFILGETATLLIFLRNVQLIRKSG